MTDLPTPPRKGKIICPQCGETAMRVKRRLRDRFLSLFKPVKRYRCGFCNWTALLPLEDTRTN